MSSYDAQEMYELFLVGFGLLGVGAAFAVLLWLMGVRSIPVLAGAALGVAALAKFVVLPWLGVAL